MKCFTDLTRKIGVFFYRFNAKNWPFLVYILFSKKFDCVKKMTNMRYVSITNFLLQASVVIIFNNEVIHCDFYAKAAHSFWKRCSPLYCGPFGVFWTELPENFYMRWAIRNILLTCKRRVLIMKKMIHFGHCPKYSLLPASNLMFYGEVDYNF